MHTETYGALAQRLEADSAGGRLPPLTVHDVHLSRYVSFSDEVRLADLSKAFDAALQRDLGPALARGERLAVITHSTGGPVLRDWWWRYYRSRARPCPVSHLIMLAPANFGSALAQLGKTRIADLKASIVDGVEPGTGVLDWLELGSAGSWRLNRAWITSGEDPAVAPQPLFQFVLTGQTIDRRLYDHANAYTGELGSDGVVRAAAANLNAGYLKLVQVPANANTGQQTELKLHSTAQHTAPRTAFALVRGRAHSNPARGILRSIEAGGRHPTYRAIQRCLQVQDPDAYRRLCDAFARENLTVRRNERLETRGGLLRQRYFHDAHAQLVVRIRDRAGRVPERFDFKLTGAGDDPDRLPAGMIVDTQRNGHDPGTLTFYLNADKAYGADAVKDRSGREVRPPLPGLPALGIELLPRPRDRYVGYARARLGATRRHLEALVRADATVLVDIELERIVKSGAFNLTTDLRARRFRDQPRGRPVPDPEASGREDPADA